MPGFVTHYLFGAKTYQELNHIELQKILHKNFRPYRLGLQGPDIFFFHVPSLRYKDHRNFGSYLHEHEMQQFFYHALSCLPQLHDTEEKDICLSYICGYLCHYKLDYIAHPFIYGRTGYDIENSDNSYFSCHFALETEIDRYLLRKTTGKSLTEFNQAATFQLSKKEKNILSKFLSQVLTRTFRKLLPSKHIYLNPLFVKFLLLEGYLEMKFLLDPYNHKKRIVTTLENLFFSYPLLSSKFVTDQCEGLTDFMNFNREEWRNPWNQDITSDSSFEMLYKHACKESVLLLSQLSPARLYTSGQHEYLKKVMNQIKNLSYHSGL
jgi:hypothetical protein